MEAPSAVCSTLRIRLTGQRFDETVGFDLSGRDHLDFMAPQYHAGVLATARAMIDEAMRAVANHAGPSGARLCAGSGDHRASRWRLWGKTAPFLSCHLRPVGDVMSATLPTDNGLGLDTAVAYQLIDVGAGAPKQTALAAQPEPQRIPSILWVWSDSRHCGCARQYSVAARVFASRSTLSIGCRKKLSKASPA